MPTLIDLADAEDLIRKAVADARAAGAAEERDRLRTLAALNGSAPKLLAKADRLPADPAPPADDADPHHALYDALLEAVTEAREAGDDAAVPGLVAAYRDHLDDPDLMAAALAGAGDGGRVEKAVGRVYLKAAAWDKDKHPRDDHGRFVSKDAIHAAAADPKKAAELRARVTDPGERKKLDAAIDNPESVGRTKRGEQRHAAHQKREKRAADHRRAGELADKVADGSATYDELHDLGDHLEGLSLDKLHYLRARIPTEGRGRRKAEIVAALRASLDDRRREAHAAELTPAADAPAADPVAAKHGVLKEFVAGYLKDNPDATDADVVALFGRGPGGAGPVQAALAEVRGAGTKPAAEPESPVSAPKPDPADQDEAMAAAHRDELLAEANAPQPSPDDHDREREEAAADKAGRMAQWAADKPGSVAAEGASRAAEARLAGTRAGGEGKPAMPVPVPNVAAQPPAAVADETPEPAKKPLAFDPAAKVADSDQTIGELRDAWKKRLGKKYAGTFIHRQPDGSVYYTVKKYNDGYHGREAVVAASYSPAAAVDRAPAAGDNPPPSVAEPAPQDPQPAAHEPWQKTHAETFRGHIDTATARVRESQAKLQKVSPGEARKPVSQHRRELAMSSSHRPEVKRAISDLVNADAELSDAQYYGQRSPGNHPLSQQHRAAVESALAAGKPVPPEVLADYPDLAPKPAAPVAGTLDNEPAAPPAAPLAAAHAHLATLPPDSPAAKAIDAALANGGGDVRRTLKELGHRHAEMHAEMSPDEEAAYTEMMGRLGAKPLHAPGETKPFDPETMHSDAGIPTGTPVKITRRGWTGLYGDAGVGHALTGNNWQRAAVEPANLAGSVSNEPAKSPQNPSTGVDDKKEIGDTTPVPATPAGGPGGKPMTQQRVKITASGRNFEQARKYLKKIGATYDAGSQTWVVPAGKELDADQHKTWGTQEVARPVASVIGGVDAEPGDYDDTDRTPY